MRRAQAITLTDEERATLVKWARGRSVETRRMQRAKGEDHPGGGRRRRESSDRRDARLHAPHGRHLATTLREVAARRNRTRCAAARSADLDAFGS
jgi:hypothetical protein